MKLTEKVRDLTLKNIIILTSYIALLILGLIYFENIISIIEISEEKMKLLEINKKNLNFEIINSKILREKYIEF